MSSAHRSGIKQLSSTYLLVIVIGSLSWIFKAWVCDDAYISFRVVDNFVDGYGMRWNIDERVQVFTNPLWTLIHIPFYALSSNIFLTTIWLSLFFSITSVVILALQLYQHRVPKIGLYNLLPLLLCFLSDSISDFSTSGLENPLLLFFFALICFKSQKRISPYLIILLINLSAATRLDSILIYIPLLFFIFKQNGKKIVNLKLLFCCSPLITWHIFSLYYYGFLFPNTLYAKLYTGIDKFTYLHAGYCYFIDFIINDPIGFLAILFSLIFTLTKIFRKVSDLFSTSVLVGILMYLLYVFWIGGDFMSGRFFSLPVFAAIGLIKPKDLAEIKSSNIRFLSIVCIAIFSFYSLEYYPNSPFGVGDQRRIYWDNAHGPISERQEKVNYTLFNFKRLTFRRSLEDHFYLRQHDNILEKKKNRDRIVIIRGAIGIFGFYAGQSVHIIDIYALSDPLLARLELADDQIGSFKVGHVPRQILMGYINAKCESDLSQIEPKMLLYYQKLNHVVSGSLLSLTRLFEIAELNLGFVTPSSSFTSEDRTRLSKAYFICDGSL